MNGPLARLAASVTAHPWRWAAVPLAALTLFPSIDITVSSWFYDPVYEGFRARVWALPEWVRRALPYYLLGLAASVALLWLAGEVAGRALLGVSRRVGAYLLLSLALGPGLVVNVLLKDNWGRPRPSTIAEFGGPLTYSPPLVFSGQCDHNCSFPSGHAALAFWLVSFALLAPPRRRPLLVAVTVAAGLAVGLSRVAQGGHFVSDVAFSAAITIGIALWLRRRLLGPAVAASSKNNAAPGDGAL